MDVFHQEITFYKNLRCKKEIALSPIIEQSLLLKNIKLRI